MSHQDEARQQLKNHGVPLGQDFHQLDSETVQGVIDAADAHRYRKSKNAPGSRARMFYEYANRQATPRRPAGRTYYINRTGDGYRETVSEVSPDQGGKKEAERECSEYQLGDPAGRYYVSTRACSNWKD